MIDILIADSSGLVSLVSEDDRNHRKALKVIQDFTKTAGSIFIPTEIFAETLNVLGKKFERNIALQTATDIFESKTFIIPDTTQNVRLLALEKFAKQKASVSFTDCLVMAFADEFETRQIFGFDESFAKNGYVRVGIDKT